MLSARRSVPVQEIPNHLHHEVDGFAVSQLADGGLQECAESVEKTDSL